MTDRSLSPVAVPLHCILHHTFPTGERLTCATHTIEGFSGHRP